MILEPRFQQSAELFFRYVFLWLSRTQAAFPTRMTTKGFHVHLMSRLADCPRSGHAIVAGLKIGANLADALTGSIPSGPVRPGNGRKPTIPGLDLADVRSEAEVFAYVALQRGFGGGLSRFRRVGLVLRT